MCVEKMRRSGWPQTHIIHVRYIWVFPKIGVPQNQNGWFIMENPIKMADLGGNPSFLETPICLHFGLFLWYINVGNYTKSHGFCLGGPRLVLKHNPNPRQLDDIQSLRFQRREDFRWDQLTTLMRSSQSVGGTTLMGSELLGMCFFSLKNSVINKGRFDFPYINW